MRFSTLRHHVPHTYGVNINNYVKLKTLLKRLAMDHAKKKSETFDFEEINHALNVFLDKNNSKDLLMTIGNCC